MYLHIIWVGVYAILAQRTAVMVFMGIELLLNAVGLNIVVFWRYVQPLDYSAQIFTIIIITIGAVEMAVGLAIMMLLYRNRKTVQVDKYKELRDDYITADSFTPSICCAAFMFSRKIIKKIFRHMFPQYLLASSLVLIIL